MAYTILIVDDDRGVREVLRASAEECGYEVIEADDGPTALSLFNNEVPDLSIIDVGLTGEYDGVELLCRMREINPRHAVIKRLFETHTASPEKAKLVAEQLLDNALISAGLLDDATAMVARLNKLLESV